MKDIPIEELPTDVSQDAAYLIAASRQPDLPFPAGSVTGRFSSSTPIFRELDRMKDEVLASTGVPRRYIDVDYAKHEIRVLALMLQQSGLPQWFEDLQAVVEGLRPDNDLLTFKKQVEELLNDERINPFRVKATGEGNEGQAQEDHDRG